MATAQIDLPEELQRELDEMASRTGRTRAELVYVALQAFLASEAEKQTDAGWPRSIGMGYAEEPSADRIDEWLEEHWRPDEEWGRT